MTYNGGMAHYCHPCAKEPFVIPYGKTRASCWPDTGNKLSALVWLVLPLTLGLAITRQSLWTDEGFTVWFASHSSFHAFLTSLIGARGAPGDPQFLFYLLYMWEWIKLFGSSELSLRAANIPFAVILIYTVSWASRNLFWRRNLWALFCLSPFFWFYLNEARPYVALVAFSTVASIMLVAYLVDPERHRKFAPCLCFIALFLAWGTHILAMFLFPALIILVLLSLASDSSLKSAFLRDWFRPALYCAPPFLLLGTFYAWVSSYGVNKIEANPSLRNLAFAIYEFAGFAGLGPPRNDIRQDPHISVFVPYWPLLSLGVISLVAVAFFVWRTHPPRIVRNILISTASGLTLALAASMFEHFQVLGRHLAAFFPLILMVAMIGSKDPLPWSSAHRKAALALTGLGMVWLISDLRLVMLNKYEKDSYREACAIALSRARQDGAVILWAADPVTAEYYGLTVAPSGGSLPGTEPSQQFASSSVGGAIAASGWSVEQTNAYFANVSVPTILVLSKAETFDSIGAWSIRIREQGPAQIAHLNAVNIFEWLPGTVADCAACSAHPPHDLLTERTSQNALPQRRPPVLGVLPPVKVAR